MHEEESAIDIANRAISQLRNSQNDGKRLALIALEKAQSERDLEGLSRAWYAIGFAKLSEGSFHEAISLAELARQDMNARCGEKAATPEMLLLSGTAYCNLGCYDISLTFLNEALQAAELGSSVRIKTSVLNSLSQTFNELGQFDKSASYLRAAIKLNSDNLFGEALLLSNLGIVLNDWGKPEEALVELDRSLAIAEANGFTAIIPGTYDNKGQSLAMLGRIEEAEAAFSTAIEAIKLIDKGDAWITANMHRGEMYEKAGRTKEALDCFSAALQAPLEKQSFSRRCKILALQAECYKDLGSWKEEAECRRAYMQLEMQGALSRGREKVLDHRLAEEQEKILGLEIHLRQRAEAVLRVQRSFIETLASVTELRDEGTGSHIRRASHYVRLLAYELVSSGKIDVSEEQLDAYITLACLHDIGKISVSDAILNKPGAFTPAERELMATHVQVGEDLIERMGWDKINELYARLAKEIIGGHHERWDGAGYLRGLKGEEIPLGGRLMAVADVYDALRAKRPYKEAMSHNEARDYIANNSGKQFDPMVVEAFLKLEERFDEVFSAES